MEGSNDEVVKAEGIPEEKSVEGDTMELPPPTEPNTAFWTECNHCKVQFEYTNTFKNRNLRCMFCEQPFRAVQITGPTTSQQNLSTPSTPPSLQKKNASVSTANKKTAARGRKRTSGLQILEKSCKESVSAEGKADGLASNVKSRSGKGKRPLKMSRLEANVTSREVYNQLETGSGGVVQENQGGRLSTERDRVSQTVRSSGRGLSRLANTSLLANRSQMEIRAKFGLEKQKDGNANAAGGN